jgi:hypothetical protein
MPSRRRDSAYFSRVREAFAGLAGVEQVVTNAATASVLVTHSGDEKALIDAARERGLFELEVLTDRPSALSSVQQGIDRADAMLRSRTKSDLSLGSVAFYALLGSTGYQIARGNFLPAGATLLFQAFNVMVRAVESERRAAGRQQL